MRKKLHTENKRIIGGNIDKMGFILKEKMDPFSAKETRRIKFQRKKHNEREAARRPFKNNKFGKIRKNGNKSLKLFLNWILFPKSLISHILA